MTKNRGYPPLPLFLKVLLGAGFAQLPWQNHEIKDLRYRNPENNGLRWRTMWLSAGRPLRPWSRDLRAGV